ncbi:MAG: hypothetical protein H7X80_04765, partial [bacterium]|nr:hypothetical protein [Candidatus Kapabacteria bacterium]
MKSTVDQAPPLGKALVTTEQASKWNWSGRRGNDALANGVEAWVFALRGDFRGVDFMKPEHFRTHDLVIVNLDYARIDQFDRLVPAKSDRSAIVVGLFEGELAGLSAYWRTWSRVADRCDLIIAINRFGVSTLESLTSTPVSYVGIPYPVDGIRQFVVPIEDRRREILLCADLLIRSPLDYLAARPLGLPMYGHVNSFHRRWREVFRHRSIDKQVYMKRAQKRYNDPALTILPQALIQEFFPRVARSLLWMNLETRYTWGRYVIDAAVLGV